ncbi:MAG TPA: hypothetical protein HA227_03005 [Candidatus Diapherotrites archaeon]|uniref:Uncharacterized protein n=1 Tax=Candidatus Iainarchaeum sp. TaxID=3101447 RepID=A0A7J4KTQ6_9ARCH|nr:hypothetical protein [Candidatus Diapherotrites archaeon]
MRPRSGRGPRGRDTTLLRVTQQVARQQKKPVVFKGVNITREVSPNNRRKR